MEVFAGGAVAGAVVVERDEPEPGVDFVGIGIGPEFDLRHSAGDERREPPGRRGGSSSAEVDGGVGVLGVALREVEDLGVGRRHLDHATGTGVPQLRVQALLCLVLHH